MIINSNHLKVSLLDDLPEGCSQSIAAFLSEDANKVQY